MFYIISDSCKIKLLFLTRCMVKYHLKIKMDFLYSYNNCINENYDVEL